VIRGSIELSRPARRGFDEKAGDRLSRKQLVTLHQDSVQRLCEPVSLLIVTSDRPRTFKLIAAATPIVARGNDANSDEKYHTECRRPPRRFGPMCEYFLILLSCNRQVSAPA
jgi:hypothetical protein